MCVLISFLTHQEHSHHLRRARGRPSLNSSMLSANSIDISLLEASLFSLSSPATSSEWAEEPCRPQLCINHTIPSVQLWFIVSIHTQHYHYLRTHAPPVSIISRTYMYMYNHMPWFSLHALMLAIFTVSVCMTILLFFCFPLYRGPWKAWGEEGSSFRWCGGHCTTPHCLWAASDREELCEHSQHHCQGM